MVKKKKKKSVLGADMISMSVSTVPEGGSCRCLCVVRLVPPWPGLAPSETSPLSACRPLGPLNLFHEYCLFELILIYLK